MRTIATCISIVAALAFASVADAASTFQIAGGGDGHGVGMSQYGAYGYALQGKSYQFILAHYYQGTALSTTDPNQTVRVLIASSAAPFSGAAAAGSKALSTGTTYSARALQDGSLVLYDQSGKKVGRFSSPLTIKGPGPLQVAGHGSYRGALELRAIGNAVQTVDAVGLDDYVRGVVADEMPSGWSMQALEAQAVAARTYAITSNVEGDGYTLYPDTRSQMYGGVPAETPSTDAAVDATSGQIVTYNGVPAETFFFASSGGYTEDVQNVWSGAAPEPWLHGVPDPYDGAGGDPYNHWSHQMTIAAAAAKLAKLVKGRLLGIRVTKRGVSPRVVTAQVVGTKGRTTVTGSQLEGVFGLPSTYMGFTAISSKPGIPAPNGGAGLTARALRRVARAAVFRIGMYARIAGGQAGVEVPAPVTPGLRGTVFPARKGDLAWLQVRTKRTWRSVKRVRLGSGGTYRVRLAVGRTYRLVFRRVAGPAVTVS